MTILNRNFLWILFVFSGFVAGISIANAMYYDKLMITQISSPISKEEATTMYYLNVILGVVAFIVFFWIIIKLTITR